VTESWRKLHNVELHNLYRVIKLDKEAEVDGPPKNLDLDWSIVLK
jgi:hypothetical protein